MFNLSGSEIVFLLIIGLVVLGPEKLPTALRKAGRLYGEFKRITSGAESEFRTTFAEPIREMQQTANTYKSIFSDAAGGVTSAAKDIAKNVAGEYNSAASRVVPDATGGSEAISNSGEVADGAGAEDNEIAADGQPDEVIEGI